MGFLDVLKTTTVTSTADLASGITAIIAGLGIFLFFIAVFAIVSIIANYKLFQKMGIEGWKALIPSVNTYFQLEATGIDPKWLIIVTFGSILNIIPFLGTLAYGIVMLYFMVLSMRSLARAFGKDVLFTIGLIILNPIFTCILAFGSSKFLGKDPMDDMIFGKKNSGSAQPTQPNVVGAAQKFCPNCGSANTADTKFCSSCGKEI